MNSEVVKISPDRVSGPRRAQMQVAATTRCLPIGAEARRRRWVRIGLDTTGVGYLHNLSHQDGRAARWLPLLLLAVVLVPAPARGDDAVGLRVQQFEPNGDGLGYFTADSARVGEFGRMIFNLHVGYATGVVGMWNGDELQAWPVRRQMGVDLGIGLGFRVADVVVNVPFAPYQEGSGIAGEEFSMHPFGDIVLRPKVQVLDPDVRPVGLAVTLPFSFPSGNQGSLYGETGVTVAPTVIGELRVGPLDVAVNLGVLGRKTTRAGGLEVGPQFLYKMALRLRPVDALGFQIEIWGYSGGNKANSPANWLGGFNVATAKGFIFRAGVGTGIGGGYGAAKVRMVVGIGGCLPSGKGTAVVVEDEDHDGVPDEVDECPDREEDIDGFEDSDGCPEVDNDSDGLADVADDCPDEPETDNDYLDDDGCPDEIPAPVEPMAEPYGIGLVDLDEEPYSGPDVDDDDWLLEDLGDIDWGDEDMAPISAEIDEPEPVDEGVAAVTGVWEGVVEVDERAGRLVLAEPVLFEPETANPRPETFGLLNKVAALLKARTDLGRIEVQGHTTERDGATSNRILGQRRGETVADYLANLGVSRDRLVVVGYGDARTTGGAEQRVEFHILDQGGSW